MAKPRVFVSSTFYDLKHIRSSLENFIESLGFEPILSEKGHIPYDHESPLDASCYREVGSSDIFVMIIGGRYGSEKSETRQITPKADNQLEKRYDSVTKEELKSAISKDIPIYIFVEKYVFADFETFRSNRDHPKLREAIKYPHVESINTLFLIEEILQMPRNNPLHQFEKYIDIENWLRAQWAGRFGDLLRDRSQQVKLSSLEAQVEALSTINTSLQSYMETLIKKFIPDDSQSIIEEETKIIRSAKISAVAKQSSALRHAIDGHRLNLERAVQAINESHSLQEIIDKLLAIQGSSCGVISEIEPEVINEIRRLSGIAPVVFTSEEIENAERLRIRRAKRTQERAARETAMANKQKEKKLAEEKAPRLPMSDDTKNTP